MNILTNKLIDEKEVLHTWLKDIYSQFEYVANKKIHDKDQCWAVNDVYERLKTYMQRRQ
jgi:hypothetical protein